MCSPNSTLVAGRDFCCEISSAFFRKKAGALPLPLLLRPRIHAAASAAAEEGAVEEGWVDRCLPNVPPPFSRSSASSPLLRAPAPAPPPLVPLVSASMCFFFFSDSFCRFPMSPRKRLSCTVACPLYFLGKCKPEPQQRVCSLSILCVQNSTHGCRRVYHRQPTAMGQTENLGRPSAI